VTLFNDYELTFENFHSAGEKRISKKALSRAFAIAAVDLVFAATHCNMLQRAATHCNTLQHAAAYCNTLEPTVKHCNTLQHTATHCNTL